MHERTRLRLGLALAVLAAAVQAAALEPAAELLRRADAEKDLAAALRILQTGLSELNDAAERSRVLARAAGISEALSELSAAQAHHEQAYASLPGAQTRPNLMRSAELLFEMGEYQKSEEQTRLVLDQAAEPRMKKRAILLLARLMDRTGRGEDALRLMREMTELAGGEEGDEKLLLYAVELGLARADSSLPPLAMQKLEKYFRDAPARYLAASLIAGKPGPVAGYPVPSRIFPPARTGLPPLTLEPAARAAPPVQPAPQPALPGTPVSAAAPAPPEAAASTIRGIQLGSFTVEENARYLVRDLGAKGVKAVIKAEKRAGKTYHMVVVPLEAARRDPDEAQKELIRLKDKGFEGFFVFDRAE